MNRPILTFIVALSLCTMAFAEDFKPIPYEENRVGLELNPVRLLFIDSWQTLSGGINYFKPHDSAEISLPFFFARHTGRFYTFNQDLRYRYFVGVRSNSSEIFIGAFVRYSRLYGELHDNILFSNSGQFHTENKLGVGFEVGNRVFGGKHFYWGSSLGIGRYLLGKNEIFVFNDEAFSMDDLEFIFDVEMLKFGYLF